VTSQLLDELKIDSSEPFLLHEILPGPVWAPIGADTCDLPRTVDYGLETMVEEENCPRAVLVAFCLEAVVALGLYGGWHALHLVR
jgi:hypothetical protein